MTREVAIKAIQDFIGWFKEDSLIRKALDMAISALSQVSEIEENIIKYMKKYPNHVGNIDFWEGFYACRNVVLQLDDEECSPKEQEPCDDAVSREAAITIAGTHTLTVDETVKAIKNLPSVTQKSGSCSNCEYEEDKNSGECYECIKGIQDWYKPKQTVRQTNCEYDKSGYCYSDDSCNYQFGDSAEFCGIHEEQKSGKWIKDECGNVICSECKRFRRDCRYGHTNYCNHCGARMDEPQESEEISERNMKMWEGIFKADMRGAE